MRIAGAWTDRAGVRRGVGSRSGLLLALAAASLFSTGTAATARAAATVVRAQKDDDSSDDEDDSKSDDDSGPKRKRKSGYTESPSRIADEQWGVEGRGGYIGFKTFGRNDSITNVEALPYVMLDQEMLFSDVRVFMTNSELFGGNFGFGYRYLVDSWDRVLGASLWYDIDQSSGEIFHQGGLSLETYGQYIDGRTNFYLPLGDTQKTISQAAANMRFVGNSIIYDRFQRIGEAMPGFDIEAGTLLPSDFAKDHAWRVYAGWYYFLGDLFPNINGYKVRMQGNITDYLYTQVEYTSDNIYGKNVTLGVALQFSGGSPKKRSPAGNETDKMRRYVQRNYNIIVPKTLKADYNLAAVNPATGQQYVVQHVDTTGLGLANGTVTDPFHSIAQAQAARGDIIFVHSGSTLNVPIIMQPGERILGEGVLHPFAMAGWGWEALPRATNGAQVPNLLNVGGSAVTLANGAEFSGFTINTPNGNGIFAPGVSGTLVRNVTINGATGDGILVQGATGNLLFQNVDINNAAGAALHVNSGSPGVYYTGAINTNAGYSLLVENTTGGFANLVGGSINQTGGNGILIQNAASPVAVGPVNIATSSAAAIDVQGGSGNVQFLYNTTVNNTGGIGVRVNGAAGAVSFNNLNSTSNGGAALLVANSGGITIGGGNLTAVNGAAADISSTPMTVILTSVSSNAAAVGVNIQNAAGTFAVLGTNALGSGGLIQNAVTGIDVQNSGTVGFQYLDLASNGVGAHVVNTDFFQLQYARVVGSTSFGVDALNTRLLYITNSLLSGNGGPADNTIRAQATAIGSYDWRFDGNTINDATAAAINVANSGAAVGSPLNLEVNANTISSTLTGSSAVQASWNGPIIGTFAGNTINASGGLNTGFNINTTSAAQLAQLTFTGNTLTFSGGNDTGLAVTTAGPSAIIVNTSQINFNAGGGTGMNFNLARSAMLDLDTNTISDNVGGGTGILFSSVAGTSSLTIDNNWIRLLGGVPESGILFNTVDTTNGLIQLNGSYNNVIQGATTTFFMPLGTSTGHFFINSTAVP